MLSQNTHAVFDLARFARELDRASDRIKQALAPLPREAAEAVVQFARAKYPVGPVHTGRTFSKRTGWGDVRRVGGGTLRDSVALAQPRAFGVTPGGQNIPSQAVRVLAPHVHFYEEGTNERFDATRPNPITGRGARRGAGPAKPGHGPIFVQTIEMERRRMEARAQAILDRDVEL